MIQSFPAAPRRACGMHDRASVDRAWIELIAHRFCTKHLFLVRSGSQIATPTDRVIVLNFRRAQ